MSGRRPKARDTIPVTARPAGRSADRALDLTTGGHAALRRLSSSGKAGHSTLKWDGIHVPSTCHACVLFQASVALAECKQKVQCAGSRPERAASTSEVDLFGDAADPDCVHTADDRCRNLDPVNVIWTLLMLSDHSRPRWLMVFARCNAAEMSGAVDVWIG